MPDWPTAWLWPQAGSEPAALDRLGGALRQYRDAYHLSQDQLGKLLKVDQAYV